jgi:hypothetical protein
MKGRQMINRMNDSQLQRLEPLYPKWLEYNRVRVFRLAPEQMAIVGQVWSEIMERRWVGGCVTCNLDAFTRMFSLYEKEIDRRFKEANDAIGKAVFTKDEPTEIVNTKEQADATPKKKVRRIKK